MGTYPKQYSEAAILVAEGVVKSAVVNRLVHEEWSWKASGSLLPSQELDAIRSRFAPDVREQDVVRFVGLVFSKVLPQVHYEFTSDGFYLAADGNVDARVIAVKELPPCFNGYERYEQIWRQDSYSAALKAVRSLIDWTLASFQESNHGSWPIDGWGQADLVNGELYRWIKGLGEFGYCRTRNVIEFIREAVPELFDQWEMESLVLTPVYHIMSNGRERFTTLRLVSQSPA